MPVDLLDPGRPHAMATALAERFAETVGRPAEAVHAAPGRVNLIGEHVDYNGGRCLPYALPHSTYVASAVRDDAVLAVRSLQRDEPWRGSMDALGPGQVSGWVSYVAGVVWALREDGIDVPGLDLVVDSTVPVGSGLSSSAALECSVALAACRAAGVQLDGDQHDGDLSDHDLSDHDLRSRVIAACVRAENEVAGASTGGMDQSVAILARPGHALLLDFAGDSPRQVRWAPEAADLSLVVVDTRAHHELNDGEYGARRADCDAAATALGVDRLADVHDLDAALGSLDDERLRRRTRHVVTELARVDAAVAALESGDVRALGPLFTASHESLRDDFEVSGPELDAVVEVALEHGALGARMTGGGFGGSAIALVPADRAGMVAEAIAATFQDHGWDAPGLLEGAPGPGARRVV
jgi:galactokinase